jgi:hypothetical protein
MSRNRLVGVTVLTALASLVLGHPETLLSQGRERSIYVTMLDKSGAPVPDLGPSDFIVREDDLAREVLRVAPATDPMDIAILLDNSVADASAVPQIRRALPAFLDVLLAPAPTGQRNQVAIITLASRPTILADYSLERAPLDKAISRVWEETFVGGYYLLNGIIEVVQGLKKRESPRPVIVAITGEGPELSSRHPDQVLIPLRDSGAALHVISIGQPNVGIGDDERYRNMVVDQGPRLSGGTHTQLLTGSALPGRLEQLGNVLTHAYKVTYGHPETLIPPQRVTVTARRPDLTAHATPIRGLQARK